MRTKEFRVRKTLTEAKQIEQTRLAPAVITEFIKSVAKSTPDRAAFTAIAQAYQKNAISDSIMDGANLRFSTATADYTPVFDIMANGSWKLYSYPTGGAQETLDPSSGTLVDALRKLGFMLRSPAANLGAPAPVAESMTRRTSPLKKKIRM